MISTILGRINRLGELSGISNQTGTQRNFHFGTMLMQRQEVISTFQCSNDVMHFLGLIWQG
jgi:hypothetical protein